MSSKSTFINTCTQHNFKPNYVYLFISFGHIPKRLDLDLIIYIGFTISISLKQYTSSYKKCPPKLQLFVQTHDDKFDVFVFIVTQECIGGLC